MSIVAYQQEGAVALITLNRPEKMNAYSADLHHGLYEAIDKADKDNSVRAIVVTGAGKAFCAGADITEGFGGSGVASGAPEIDGVARDYGGMLNLRIFEADTPIIGAVNGVAVGIGATMLLPMDIKVASEKSKFAFPFTRRGIVFDGAASWFLPRIVGFSKAQEWSLTGRLIMAEEALSSGMIQELAPAEKVLDRAMEIANDIAQNTAPESVAQNKQLMRASMVGGPEYDGGPMRAHMDESARLIERFGSEDCKEGVTSFFEKRAPNFKDRD